MSDIVESIWKRPETKTKEDPFEDIPEDSYVRYYTY